MLPFFSKIHIQLYFIVQPFNYTKFQDKQKPAAHKPTEQKPGAQKPSEQKPAAQKPTDPKPAELEPTEQKPAEKPTAKADEKVDENILRILNDKL